MNYYEEIEHLIKKKEINKKSRYLKDNSETLNTYWQVGKLIVEAQGGNSRAKYGNKLIKEWSEKLVNLYGNSYNYSNLNRFRQFYILFPIIAPLGQLSWTIIKTILPIKDENKRNYYINLCITRNLSKRELINEIKSDAYERLLDKPEHIEIIGEINKKEYKIREYIKNPIIIKLNNDYKILKEKDLQIKILAELKTFFEELGEGYTFVGNEYKIKYGGKDYYIDILLFNYNLNSFVVIELKLRELRKEDKAQIEFYMNLVDDNLKKEFHNNTIGIIVSKYQDKFIVSFVSSNNIIPITYKILK